MTSYKILSEHYEGAPSVRSSPKVEAKDIKSGPGSPPTVGSFGHASNTVLFRNGEAVTITSNNRFPTPMRDYLRNGPVTQIDDYYFGHWIHAGTDNPPNKHSIIQKMPDIGLIVSPRLGMYFPNEYDTPVSLRTSHDIVNAVDPNRLGYFHSKLANFDVDLRNLMLDNANRLNYEATEWIDFLAGKGFSIDTTPNPGVIGLGVEKGDFTAAYYPLKGYLIREENFQKKAKDWISRYGLSEPEAVEAMKRSIILHEFGHVVNVKGRPISNRRIVEKTQGLLQAEYYSMMAERFKGTKMERIYKALAQEGRDYAKEFSFNLADLTSIEDKEGDIGVRRLEHKFLHEAIALGVEDVGEYVHARMMETIGAIISGEPSYRSSSNSKNNKDSNSKKLEEIVDEKEKAEMEADSRSNSKIDKSEYKSMKDAREKDAKSEKEAPQEAETADDTMAEAA